MEKSGRIWIFGLAIVLGVVITIAGFVGGRPYAGILGLLITALNIRPWLGAMRARRSSSQEP